MLPPPVPSSWLATDRIPPSRPVVAVFHSLALPGYASVWFGGGRVPRLGRNGSFRGSRSATVPRAIRPLTGGVFPTCLPCLRSPPCFSVWFLERLRNGLGTAVSWRAVPPPTGGVGGLARLMYALFAVPPGVGGTAERLFPFLREEDRGKRPGRLWSYPLVCFCGLPGVCLGKVGPRAVPPFRRSVPGRGFAVPPVANRALFGRAGGKGGAGARASGACLCPCWFCCCLGGGVAVVPLGQQQAGVFPWFVALAFFPFGLSFCWPVLPPVVAKPQAANGAAWRWHAGNESTIAVARRPVGRVGLLPSCPSATLPFGILAPSLPSSRTGREHKTRHKRFWQAGHDRLASRPFGPSSGRPRS